MGSGVKKFMNKTLLRVAFVIAVAVLVVSGVSLLAYKWFAPTVVPSATSSSNVSVLAASNASTNNLPQSTSIEERWGIRVSMVGVTADGGLIDFRYVVVDPNKALDWMADIKNVPTLVVENSGAEKAPQVNVAALMPHKQDFHAGRTYFLLYRNTRGAIKPGSKISVVIGDLKLEGVPVL
jgi:hypothetical protein